MKIIKIGAVWCPGCLVMKKIWKNIIQDYNDLEIVELDYDMDSVEVKKYNVGNVLPVIVLMSDNNIELSRLIGEQKEDIIRQNIDRYRGNL